MRELKTRIMSVCMQVLWLYEELLILGRQDLGKCEELRRNRRRGPSGELTLRP